jgi:uncharacterized membrane protein YhfC
MDILSVTYFLNGFLMIAMPIALVVILTRRWNLAWRVWWIGAATFVLSQMGHIPFNGLASPLFDQFAIISLHPSLQLLIKAVFLGLSAGLFEEGARYLVLRFWLKDARSWRSGVLFGAGHGGMEAILVGLLASYAAIQIITLSNATPEQLAQLVGADKVALAQSQLAAALSVPWYATLLGALERFFTLPCQIAMAVMVMQAFTRKKFAWLLVAIGYHTLLDGLVVFLQPSLTVYQLEGVIGIFAVVSVVIILLLRQPEPITNLEPASVPSPVIRTIRPVEETLENLDNSRYHN